MLNDRLKNKNFSSIEPGVVLIGYEAEVVTRKTGEYVLATVAKYDESENGPKFPLSKQTFQKTLYYHK